MINIHDTFYVKSSDSKINIKGENGGAVSSILKYLLETGTVDAVLGVEARMDIYDIVPKLITKPEDIVNHAGSQHFGTINLSTVISKYLNGARDMKLAVTVKPCEAMSINELIKRGNIDKNNIIMVGLNCAGTMPPVKSRKMMELYYNVNPDDIVKEEINKGKLIIKTIDGHTHKIAVDILEDDNFGRRSNCRRCDVNIPRMADLACGNWGVIGDYTGDYTFIEVCSTKGADVLSEAFNNGFIELEKPSDKSIIIRQRIDEVMVKLSHTWQEKDWESVDGRDIISAFAEYKDEFSRCIKCYGCREVCPICLCEDCCLNAYGPEWIEKGMIPVAPIFHMTRMSHMAESCINCGQCEEVCPGDIPLAKIWHEVGTNVKTIFGYKKGIDDSLPPLGFYDIKAEDK